MPALPEPQPNDNFAAEAAGFDADTRARFERDGYAMIPGFLDKAQAAHYRDEINAAFDLPAGEAGATAAAGKTFTLADGVTANEAFWPLIFDPRLLACVRSLLGPDIRYTQHSDLHINLPGGRWHRDSACRDFGVGADWDEVVEPYRVVRIAIYLSDYSDSGSSLVLLPGSHRRESALNRREYVAWNHLRTHLRRRGRNDLLPHWSLTRPMRTVRTKPGDCVIFDQRLLHAGGVLSGQFPKYAVYLSYGVPNAHSRRHREFFLGRPTYSPDIPEALTGRLAEAGLLLDT